MSVRATAFVAVACVFYKAGTRWRPIVYRRLFLALSLLGCGSAAPAQLRADDTAYELRGPGEAAAGKHHESHNVGSQHGDQVRPELSGDVVEVPPSIPSTVKPATLIQTIDEPPGTAAPDTVGAFRFMCEPGQISYDDPIVYPNQPGKSHLHQFFGNTAANASSTYRSLRTTGDSTCVNILNRSAYWMPAMLDGRGHVVRPDYVTVYYKRLPSGSAECHRQAKDCIALPRGLRFIFGYDMVTGKTPTGGSYFDCNGPTAKPGHYKTITEAAANCPAGNRLGAIVFAPGCWDGVRLDSPNHRDHMANPGYGSWGYLRCPSTHPYVVPSFTLASWYSVDEQRADSWYLSSDEMPGMDRMPAGSTFHADWFGAWDDDVMAMWTADCLEALKSCNSGVLGGRRMMKQIAPFVWKTPRRLVPIPPRPGAATSAGKAVATR